MLKIRDLSITKNYRDAIKKWGEPDIARKRVIIAPPMAGAAAKNVDLRPMKTTNQGFVTFSGYAAQQIEMLFKQIKLDEDSDMFSRDKFVKEYFAYSSWLEEQKKLRADLNGFGLSTKWLLKKSDRSALEDRVLGRMQKPPEKQENEKTKEEEQDLHNTPTPPPLSKAQMKLLPLLQQPIPVALSIIAEYCHNNHLRLLDLYTEIDKDKDWLVSREEFCKIIKDNKIPLTNGQLEEMIIGLDADNNDQLDYRELAQGVEAYRIDDRWQKIREVMSIVEARKSGAGDSKMSREKSTSRIQRSKNQQRKQSRRNSRFKTDESGNESDLSDMSQDFLELPKVDTAIKTDATAIKARERRLKKHKERKEKQRKQKQKQATSKGYFPSTMEGMIGRIKDKYAERTVSNVRESLDMMHRDGIPVKEDAVKRVLMFPFDKSVEDCKSSLRQPGTHLVGESTFDKSKQRSGLDRRRASQDGDGLHGHHRDRCQRRKRSTRHNKAQNRRGSPFWTEAEGQTIFTEDLRRRTPTDSIFRVVRSPSYL